jgi:hypothetical protein
MGTLPKVRPGGWRLRLSQKSVQRNTEMCLGRGQEESRMRLSLGGWCRNQIRWDIQVSRQGSEAEQGLERSQGHRQLCLGHEYPGSGDIQEKMTLG